MSSIQEYEPRVAISSLTIEPNQSDDGFDVEMSYKILGLRQPPVTVDFFLSRTR